MHQEPVALLALCTTEAERLQLNAPDLHVTVTGDDTTVPGDAHRLAQILANLLDNAHRHGTAERDETATVTMSVTRHADHATVDVADTGGGVAPSQRELIFHRFVRQHTSGGQPGAGLGLAIARGIARAHGGDLRCEQTPSGTHGAVFRLTLPLRPTTPNPRTGNAPSSTDDRPD